MPSGTDAEARTNASPTLTDNDADRVVIWPTGDPTAGAEATFTDAWASQRPSLLAFVRARVRDADTAAEIVQEAYARLWQALPETPARNVAAWLFTVTRNLVRDYHRARTRHPLVAWEDWMAERRPMAHHPATLDPASTCTAADEATRVRRIVDALPPAYRQVLVLRYWRGHSVAEIAAMLTAARDRAATTETSSASPITTACVKWRLVEARRRVAWLWSAAGTAPAGPPDRPPSPATPIASAAQAAGPGALTGDSPVARPIRTER